MEGIHTGRRSQNIEACIFKCKSKVEKQHKDGTVPAQHVSTNNLLMLHFFTNEWKLYFPRTLEAAIVDRTFAGTAQFGWCWATVIMASYWSGRFLRYSLDAGVLSSYNSIQDNGGKFHGLYAFTTGTEVFGLYNCAGSHPFVHYPDSSHQILAKVLTMEEVFIPSVLGFIVCGHLHHVEAKQKCIYCV